MKQIGPWVGVSFKRETPTLDENLNSGGLRHHTAACDSTCSVYLSVVVKGEDDKTITAGSLVTVTWTPGDCDTTPLPVTLPVVFTCRL